MIAVSGRIDDLWAGYDARLTRCVCTNRSESVCRSCVQHGVRHGDRLVVAEKRLPRDIDAEEIPQGFLSRNRGCNTQLGDVRPLYYQLGRVRSADVQGTGIGVEDRQFGNSLSASRNAGRSYPEAEEGSSGTVGGAAVCVGDERVSDQTRRFGVQLSTR